MARLPQNGTRGAALSRRDWLRAFAGASVALPLLSHVEHFEPFERKAWAGPAVFPRRLVVFYTPHGTIPSEWTCSGTERDFALSGILAPLEPHKRDLVILKNIDLASAGYGPGDTHQEGMGALLCGAGLLSGNDDHRMDTGAPVGWGSSISVDQYIADRIGKETKLPSVEAGVNVDRAVVASRMIYRGPDRPVPPEDDPGKLFDRLFSALGADPAGVARLRAERRSVLDVVAKQFVRVAPRLAAADRAKLDAHATALRDIESRLEAPAGVVGGACRRPARPGGVTAHYVPDYPAIGKLQMDVLAMALACDVTRVASLQWSHAALTPGAPWLGINDSHHALSHAGDGDAVARVKLSKIKRWYAEQFAYFVGALRAIPEGSGTLLDNTLVFWGTEISIGNTHSHKDMPFVLAGGCGGYVKTGRFVTYPEGTRHNDLLVAFCHAMGLRDVKTFGNAKYCSGGALGRLGA